MDGSKALEDQIAEAVVRFERDEMSLTATSVSVNLQPGTLFVMLEGLTFPAEKACAQGEHGEELLEQYHARLYDASRGGLEAEIAGILGRAIRRSALRLDPLSGTGTMQFMLGEPLGGAQSEPRQEF